MQQLKIGIFDSGCGGLTVARQIRELLPDAALLYLSDNGRAPYGQRQAEEVLEFSRQITDFLLENGADLIVIACNTATSVAIQQLRVDYPAVLFAGMEPAVKPAAAQTKNGRIGVMATELTLSGNRFQKLVAQYAKGTEILVDPCIGLVPLIEAGDWESQVVEDKLSQILQPMIAAEIDTLVLGCTHYPLLRPTIEKLCRETVNIIDPAPATARQVVRLCAQIENSFSKASYLPLHRFWSTGSILPLTQTLAKLQWPHRLVVSKEEWWLVVVFRRK